VAGSGMHTQKRIQIIVWMAEHVQADFHKLDSPVIRNRAEVEPRGLRQYVWPCTKGDLPLVTKLLLKIFMDMGPCARYIVVKNKVLL
jgi:hypothetical protein